ncbi:MAG: hypothetical protein ACRDUS_21995 [Mycobacterium sp.]
MAADQLVENAKNGSLVLHLDSSQFEAILTACDTYIDGLKSLKSDAQALSNRKLGFSEEHLDSGAQLARKFQAKASGDDHSAANTFQSHVDRVEEMKSLFLALRAAYEGTEQSNAKSFGGFTR